jgi:hypothetical protein
MLGISARSELRDVLDPAALIGETPAGGVTSARLTMTCGWPPAYGWETGTSDQRAARPGRTRRLKTTSAPTRCERAGRPATTAR